MTGKEDEREALTSSDLLARIQALEEKQSLFADPRVDDFQEKINVQAKKILRLEQRMLETRQKLRRSSGSRGIGIEDDDSVLEEDSTFPNNTFSFLLLVKYPFCERKTTENVAAIEEADRMSSSDYMCLPFWLALSILVIQLAIYSLALQNVADFGNPGNPFQFPINVDPYTRAAELLAVIITVYTQNNIFQGVDLFVQSFKYIREVPGVTAWKYYTAATTQTIVGIYGIFVTFVIIMQSPEVVDLLLDFTAMEFVAALDDAAFALCLRGFLGRAMKKTARTVKTARYTQRDKRTWLRKWPMLVVAIVLITCYAIVRVEQNNRFFGDNEIVIQLHDDAIPWLATLSGTYIGCTMFLSDSRKLDVDPIIYTKHPANGCDKNWKKEQAAFFFCEGNHWVFAVGDNMNTPCSKWTLKSYKADASNADAYDIVSHSAASWFAKDLNSLVEDGVADDIRILPSFKLAGSSQMDCEAMEATGLAFPFPFYSRLDNLLVGNRPAFYASDNLSGEFVLFNGRRWIVVEESSVELECLPGCDSQANPLECKASCLKSLDLFTSKYTVRLISDPMDLRTTSDTWIPTEELIWYTAEGSGSSAAPDVDKISLAQSLQETPALLDAVASKKATPEQLEEAASLFVQSSSMGCNCQAYDDDCKPVRFCPDGSPQLLIDLVTDDFGEETSFFMLDVDSYATFAKEAANVFDPEWLPKGVGLEGVEYLNDTGFFSLQNVRSIPFESSREYRYKTCMSENSCAVLSFEDSAGDGIYFPGKFDIFYEGQRLSTSKYTGIKHCLYEFGPGCETSVNCSSTSLYPSFNPDMQCPDGTPLSFEGFAGISSNNLYFEVKDFDSWVHGSTSNITALTENGNFTWGGQDVAIGDKNPYPRHSTCVPNDVCALIDVSFGEDGFFHLNYNRTAIEPDNNDYNPEDHNVTYCLYQLGSSCNQPGVVCSDVPVFPEFNPVVDCPSGNPLAFQVKTDLVPLENTLMLMDIDSWNASQQVLGQSDALTSLNATTGGEFPFENVQINFTEADTAYFYSTCVPEDICAVLVFNDTGGDGGSGSGIKVAYDGAEVSLLVDEAVNFSSCEFQFGACEQVAFCS
eukprot:scaffold5418_cov107-Cylindrotheca_fusiformis.AAC.1